MCRLTTITALLGICLTISAPPVGAEPCERTGEEGAATFGYCLFPGRIPCWCC